MRSSAFVALASSAGLAAAKPFAVVSRGVTTFAAGSSWDILLNKGDSVGNVKQVVNEKFQVIDIDLFDTDKETITELNASKQVVCYFSAGSKEGWRSDAGDFKAGDTGKALDGWPDENWVNIKSENVRAVMKKRIQMAAANGCTAIDPDNVDGFDGGQDGFGYDKSAYVDYVKFMAQEAKSNGLAIGLKNAVDLIPEVVDVMQFAVNEQCHEYRGECALYKPFTDQNKAVFNIEYGGSACSSPAGVKLSTLIKSEDQALNALGGACAGQNTGTPTSQGSSKPSASVVATASAGTFIPTKTAVVTATATAIFSAPAPTATNSEEDDDDGDDDEGNENRWGWGWWYGRHHHHD